MLKRYRIIISGGLVFLLIIIASYAIYRGRFSFHADTTPQSTKATLKYIDSSGNPATVQSNDVNLTIISGFTINNMAVDAIYNIGSKIYAIGLNKSNQDPILAVSTDSGKNWTRIGNTINKTIISFNALSNTALFAVASDGGENRSFYYSKNGTDFTELSNTCHNNQVTAVIDANNAFAIVCNKLYRTTNGGENWTSTTLVEKDFSQKSFNFAHVYDSNNIIISRVSDGLEGQNNIYIKENIRGNGIANGVMYSSNGGSNWAASTGLGNITSDVMAFVPSTNKIILASFGTIYLSNDKGHVFSQVKKMSISNNTVNGIDGTHFLNLGNSRNTLASADSGATWSGLANPSGTEGILSNSVVLNSSTILATGYTIYDKMPLAIKATFSGSSWSFEKQTIDNAVAGQTFGKLIKVNDTTVMAIDNKGAIYMKSDSDSSWRTRADYFTAHP